MKLKLFFFALLLTLASGCSTYRYSNYTLEFTDSRFSEPMDRKPIEIVFAHELFPLNAPATIHTNLDANGAVALRLPNHFPTWIFVRSTNSAVYSFSCDLRLLHQNAGTVLSVSDKHTGECHLLLSNLGKTK